jgi:hypothetical protein
VAVLDDVAVPIVTRARTRAALLFLDELGKMELCSAAFEQAVRQAFDQGPPIVATAGVSRLPFLEALKRRKDVELIPLTPANRAAVEEELTARLNVVCAEDDAVRALQRQADRICEMIVSGEVPLLDIEIHQTALREAMARTVPDQPGLYPLIYESRFRRLWQQFRHH